MTAVDVAAIRAALEAATPGRLSLTEDELGPRFDREVGGVTVYDVDPADGKADAELIVLLRNNAEALLRMLDDGYCAGYDHGVEDQMDRQEAALADAERRGAVKALTHAANLFAQGKEQDPTEEIKYLRAYAMEITGGRPL